MNLISNSKQVFNKSAPVTVILTLLLTGCVSLSFEPSREENERTCFGYGFKPNTDAMANCLLQTEQGNRADMRAQQLYHQQNLLIHRSRNKKP